MTDFYRMEFICSNCGTSFTRDIKKGERAKGKGNECPYCGYWDNGMFGTFRCRKPRHIEREEKLERWASRLEYVVDIGKQKVENLKNKWRVKK